MTNLEKYKKYENEMNRIGDQFCMSFFPLGLPRTIFSIRTNFTKHKYGLYVQVAEVEKIMYHFKNEFNKPYYNKRPSKEQVEEIKLISGKVLLSEMKKENVCIHVRSGNTSWGVNLKDLDEKKASFDKPVMESVLVDKTKHYIDNYFVKDDQFACAYCRKATDNNKKVKKTIFARQYRNSKVFDYCSDQCGVYDQMGHEG